MIALFMLVEMMPSMGIAVSENVIVSELPEAPAYHTLTFIAEEQEVTTVFVADGASLGFLPDAPEADGKTFEGWYTGEELFSPETAVYGDQKIVALYRNIEIPDDFKEDTKTNETENAGVQTLSAYGSTYKITVTYGSESLIPEGTYLRVKEEDGRDYLKDTKKALEFGEKNELYYIKYLSVSLVYDEKEIQPKAPVLVEAELTDLPKATDAIDVVCFLDDSARKVWSESNEHGIVTFKTDTLCLFGFSSALYTLLSWNDGKAEISLEGFADSRRPACAEIDVKLEEGLELISAYAFQKTRGGQTNAPFVSVETDLKLDDRESITVYSLVNGEIGELIAYGEDVRANLGDAEGFVIVKDTGYRRKSFDLGGVELNGLIPKGASATASKAQIELEGDVLAAYDIRIDEYGSSYQPDKAHPVDVTIDIPEKADNIRVWHIREDGTAEEINSVFLENEKVKFTAAGFSIYAVTGNVYRRTYEFYSFDEYGDYTQYPFYTDTGETVFSQTVKNGETPIVPGNPTNPMEPEATFAGWYEGSYNESGDLILDSAAYDFAHIPEITSSNNGEVVRLYARFKSYALVIFHDQYDQATGSFPVAGTLRVELTGDPAKGTAEIGGVSVVYSGSNDMTFYGWSYTPITTPGSEHDDYYNPVSRIETNTIEVTETTHLYPIFKNIYWLSFYSGYAGSGATYYPDVSYFDGIGPDSLAAYIPSRDAQQNGSYMFVGWYVGATLDENGEAVVESATKITDENGTLIEGAAAEGITVTDGHIVLTSNVTLYAAWNTDDVATYTITVWKQKAADASGIPDDQKTWDYAESFTLSAEIGSTVSVGENYKELNTLDGYNAVHTVQITANDDNPYSGFTYNSVCSDETPKTLQADGSTAFSVYYDRNEGSQPPSGSYALTFEDSIDGDESTSADLPKTYPDIAYGTSLSVYADSIGVPASGRNGYSFTNWYADPACTIAVFFAAPSRQELADGGFIVLDESTGVYSQNKPYAVYDTMPDRDVTVYAGWEEEWYIVTIDPNYGALGKFENGAWNGTGATWFWAAYGSRIEEYTTVTRDYVESDAGTWYYVKHDRSAGYADRYTYYTQDPAEATEYTTFEYEPGIYRYAGWYEVDPDTGEETRYDFTRIVERDTTIRLHWTKVGAYYLEYDAGDGSLTSGEDLETVYVDLDNGSYMDNAQVVITRIANAPEGYEFTGWTIRQDQSQTVYSPGQAFTLLTSYAVTVQGKKTVYLDAVYTRVPTATIVYHANGGTMDTANIDYGSVGTGVPVPTTAYDEGAGTVTVSNLQNNGIVYLSDGSMWLTREDASFAGWCANEVFDPADENAPLLLTNGEYYFVDTAEPTDLYAVWQTRAEYHLNKEGANWGGEWDADTYTQTTENGETFYTQDIYLGGYVEAPAYTPESGDGTEVFRYWAKKDQDTYTQFDFGEPVEGALTLYAYWDEPAKIKVHAIDASAPELTEKADWVTEAHISVLSAPNSLDEAIARQYVTPDTDVSFAFAFIREAGSDIQSVTESDAADALFYDSAAASVMARRGEETFALGETDELYFVFYEKKTLPIYYRLMSADGTLTTAEVNTNAPADTGSGIGLYDLSESITSPLAWLDREDYPYYAYAIGASAANNVSGLTLITDSSDSDSSRPALSIENTWRGLTYSTDSGSTWNSCGYNAEIYVVYYQMQASVITFSEKTVGLPDDMELSFEYHYAIEESRDNGQNWDKVYSTQDDEQNAITLSNGEEYSAILFTGNGLSQRITVTQTPAAGMVTRIEGTQSNVYTYTADAQSQPQTVTFVNTRDTVSIEVHVALVSENGGTIMSRDDIRSEVLSDYSFDLNLDEQANIAEKLPPEVLFTGDDTDYAFGTVLISTSDITNDSVITPEGDGIAYIAYEPTDEPGVCLVTLKDDAGEKVCNLNGYNIFYLYYPMPVIRYVEETAGGMLTDIKGSLDGASETDDLTYSQSALTLNGVTVEQGQRFKVPHEGLTVSQETGSFRMPPLLDAGTNPLYLVYSKIGVGDANITNIESITASEALTLYLRIQQNSLEYSFDASEWSSFSGTPTIYAIYRERGYNLRITKTVPIDTGFREPFSITVSSNAIGRSSYSAEGLPSSTVAAVPNNGQTPGTISFTVTDGSDITLIGMGAGEYTITENGHDNFELSAQIRPSDGEAQAAEIIENSSFTFSLSAPTQVDMVNTPVYICQVGSNKFYTLSGAVEYIRDYSSDFSGTIEMLVDYIMPSSDAPEIPDYMNVTLTTTSSFAGTAVIERRDTFTSGAMITNCGTLTLQNVVLDGAGVSASSALIDNQGTLTAGNTVIMRNANNSANGGAINSWAGEVNILTGATVTQNSASQGGAIFATGGSVNIQGGTVSDNIAVNGGAVYYSGSESVSISGGSLEDNSAQNGGAVYMESGSLTMTDGSIGSSSANENGGAIYVSGAAVDVSGGTIGGEGNGNTAKSGGAIYLESGSVTVSGTAVISHNTALDGNGGAISANTASVTVSGGSISDNISQNGSGGAVYAESGAVTVSGGSISNNRAGLSGGGIYAQTGAVALTGTASGSTSSTNISNNISESGNGGGIYAGTGSVTVNNVYLSGNGANNGNGGGLWSGSGAAVITNASVTGNSAINGAAIFEDTGSVTFNGSNVQNNTAANGGAVGVGSAAAKLYFAGNVKVTGNTMEKDGENVASNVYLDQDIDTVINAKGLGSGAAIGVYVPDVSADGATTDLFERRGMPSAFFATYTSDTNVNRFTNDRLPGLTVQKETNSKRLYWGKAFEVEVRYLATYSNGVPPTATGTVKYTNLNYYAPSSNNPASALAEDLYDQAGSSTAVFGHAFVSGSASFDDYITDINWNSELNRWSFVKRDGSETAGTRLILYYTEPAYISIENNTAHTLEISDLKIRLNQTDYSVINSQMQTGYGYVFAKNGSVQDTLLPVNAADLVLPAGKSVRIMLPGGRNAAYTLSGSLSGASESISYRRTGENEALLSPEEAQSFTFTSTTLSGGGLYEIVFGGSSAICRIVTEDVGELSEGETAGRTITPNADGKIEYTFSTLNQAKAFIVNHSLKTAKIEMLVDYIIPASDVLSLPAGYDITLSTATEGEFVYSGESSARATISRGQGNNLSFITVPDGTNTTSLKAEHLIFDGKNFSGSIDGGVIKTKNCDVEISNVDFNNCVANNGGGIYIESSNVKNGILKVTDSSFTNCVSKSTASRQGGGAIWMNGKTMELENCTFVSCTAQDQGGAVFHRIDNNYDSSTSVTNCSFTGCSANAAGSMETDAKDVTVSGCSFKDSTARQRNGGAFNVFALNNANPANECHVTVKDSSFENCFALTQNGGGFRSTATHTTVENCTFKNCTGNNGGAISMSSTNAVLGTVTSCSIDGGVAANQGGGIYCMVKTFVMDGEHNTIVNCTAQKEGGGIYHGRKASQDASFSMANCSMENCVSIQEEGGGVHTLAKTVVISDSSLDLCSTPKQGGGVFVQQDRAGTLAFKNVNIEGATAVSSGGGLYYDGASGELTVTGGSISHNTSGAMGGGVYTNCQNVTVSQAVLESNTAAGNGGGICHNKNDATALLKIVETNISGNSSGGKGGGVYTLASLAIADVTVTGNWLNSTIASDAAGVYMPNGRTLTIGTSGSEGNDSSVIRENYTENHTPSSLRLPMSSSVNSNSVRVLCGLDGEIRVVNAARKGTQYGESSIEYPYGVSDMFHVFMADDDSLYGIINRQDETKKKIIWAGDPICKITDEKGRLLFLDTSHTYPAVFDVLDDGSTNASKTSPFGLLRSESPELYNADGTPYTGSTYQVKMLVENYTATKKITTPANANRTIIFTTAGGSDSLYPYKGRTGTRSTVAANVGNNALVTARSNLTLTNIVLDGGSESGVTANSNTRLITTNTNEAIRITLGRNAALQNASTTGNGGGVLINGSASLSIEGGTIRNCTAAKGGGVYKDGETGTLSMTGGSITKCTATNSGGGVCLYKGKFVMSGGSITRCEAASGGGVYIPDNKYYHFTMTGGSITANSATVKGGGIASQGKLSRIYFAGAPYVYGNTLSGKACNVQMDQAFTYPSTADEWTQAPSSELYTEIRVINQGLTRGAAIGVYVPDDSNLYASHGVQGKPFATFDFTADTGNLYYFINDRNGLKGGLMEGQHPQNNKVYWRDIYSLEVSKTVLSDDPADANKSFTFRVTLSGTATQNGEQTSAADLNGTFGSMNFIAGETVFTLKGGETMAAVKLPLGFDYTVTEILSQADQAYYVTMPSVTQTGHMDNSSQYVYTVSFTNLHAVCKITDTTYGLLYYKDGDSYRPAVYSKLLTAFNHLKTQTLYYRENETTFYQCPTVNTSNTKVEMLVSDYTLDGSATFHSGTKATLTTADPAAIDGFPYAGDGTAVISRGYNGVSMLNVQGDLTLGNITLDGGKENGYTANTNGGALNVASGGTLTVGSGSTVRNSVTTADGAGIYLTEGSKLKISGDPSFSGNTVSVSHTSAKNGGESIYTAGTAEQDIYIAGYQGTNAVSVEVTGNLTGAPGSVWVWAEQTPHYTQGRQFAVMTGGTYSGLDVFRNVRTDEETDNPLKTDPLYLHGVSCGDGYVYWCGVVNVTVTKVFTDIDVDDLPEDFAITGYGSQSLTLENGMPGSNGLNYTWTLENVPIGTLISLAETGYEAEGYNFKSDGSVITASLRVKADQANIMSLSNAYERNRASLTVSKTVGGNMGDRNLPFAFTVTLGEALPANYSPANGVTLSADRKTLSFSLKHGGSVVLDEIPMGVQITITETAVDGYATKHDLLDGTQTEFGFTDEARTCLFAMPQEDTQIGYYNNYDVTIPTGIQTDFMPYILLLGLSAMLAVMEYRRKKHAKEEN